MSLSLSRFFIFLATILFSFSLLGISTIDAKGDGTTIILEELPGIDNAGFKAALKSDHPGEAAGYYINGLLTLGIGLATVLAVLMITIGGFQYITTDSFMQKSEGKKRIQDSLMGLGLILVSYLLLGTINSDLLKIRFGLSPISLEAESIDIINIENITIAAVRENNQYTLERCKKGDTDAAGHGISLKNTELGYLNRQIREAEEYKQKAKNGRSNDKTHVFVENMSSKDPDGFWWWKGYYADYAPKYFIKPSDSKCDNLNKEGQEKCLSIEDYINRMDGIIARLNNLKNKCEEAE